MSSNFFVWGVKNIDGMAALDRLENVEDDQDLMYGRSRKDDWPSDASLAMRADRKDNTLLTDTLFNTDSLVIASEKLVGVLDAQKVTDVELLPVTIYDHKNKPVKARYFILNPVGLVDGVDVKASGGKKDKLDPDTLGSWKRLVLDDKRIPPERQLFRTKQVPPEYIIRKKLAEAIDAAGTVGPRWIDPLTFHG